MIFRLNVFSVVWIISCNFFAIYIQIHILKYSISQNFANKETLISWINFPILKNVLASMLSKYSRFTLCPGSTLNCCGSDMTSSAQEDGGNKFTAQGTCIFIDFSGEKLWVQFMILRQVRDSWLLIKNEMKLLILVLFISLNCHSDFWISYLTTKSSTLGH